jgi:hypothetical protein
MKSAFECFENAASCERRAEAAHDMADKTVLLGLAYHWRTPGEIAERIDRQEIIGVTPEPKDPPALGRCGCCLIPRFCSSLALGQVHHKILSETPNPLRRRA